MDKLTFIRNFDGKDNDNETREINKIEFELPGDLDSDEFQVVCIRLAKSLGYTDINIKNSLGIPKT